MILEPRWKSYIVASAEPVLTSKQCDELISIGQNCCQVFLHYNKAGSLEAEQNKFDKRPFLGLPSWFKK